MIVIVLTGAPKSGKSKLLSRVDSELEALGMRTEIIPETATELLSSGLALTEKTAKYAFQKALFRTQLAKEDAVFEALASERELWSKENDDDTIVICDRCLGDTALYLPPAEWRKLFDDHGLDKDTILARYDAIINLGTSVVLPGKDINDNSSNPNRIENSYYEYLELERRGKVFFSSHPAYYFIEAKENLEDKLFEVMKTIRNLLFKD